MQVNALCAAILWYIPMSMIYSCLASTVVDDHPIKLEENWISRWSRAMYCLCSTAHIACVGTTPNSDELWNPNLIQAVEIPTRNHKGKRWKCISKLPDHIDSHNSQKFLPCSTPLAAQSYVLSVLDSVGTAPNSDEMWNPTSKSCNTVHVTSYLNFSAEIRCLPSRNSVNVRNIFRRASTPALQTGRRNIPTAEHFPWNTVVSRRRRDRFHPPSESSLATRD